MGPKRWWGRGEDDGVTGLPRRPRTSAAPSVGDRQALARLLEDIATSEGPDLSSRVEVAAFGDLHGALAYLHRRWVTRLGVAVDEEMEAGAEPRTAPWRAWKQVAQQHPGLASILDHYAEDPAVVAAERRHSNLLASAVGCGPQELPHFGAARCDRLVGTLTLVRGGKKTSCRNQAGHPSHSL